MRKIAMFTWILTNAARLKCPVACKGVFDEYSESGIYIRISDTAEESRECAPVNKTAH